MASLDMILRIGRCNLGTAFSIAVISLFSLSVGAESLRPPAVPLVAHDPYFSIWSPADKLTDADTVHWTGKPHRLTSLVRIDGKGFRVMGKEPASIPALPQTKVEVLPTRTIYTFEGEGVRLTLTFMTPSLPDDLDVLARPVTYVTWTAQSTDTKSHRYDFYLDASAELAVNEPSQEVRWTKQEIETSRGDRWINGVSYYFVEKLEIAKLGSREQQILAKKGDDIRIDWGNLLVAAHIDQKWKLTCGSAALAREQFANLGRPLAVSEEANPPAQARDIVESLVFEPAKESSNTVSRWAMLAYDDEYSIQYMRKILRPYWRRNGDDADALLKKAAADYESLKKRCEKFDDELMADLRKAGGEHYAQIGALAYRQCFAAGKFVADANGKPLQFCKENHSNGCIGTSDVFYPMAPQFLLFGPTLAKSFLVPFMNYAASPRWKFPFAPHDLGTYPHANGQVYGGGERTEQNQMPVEESGNLLILFGAIAQMEGNADFAGLYWKQLEQWAEYLKAKGFDPENQLCTDDFAGHLAHNVNLSVKAICGLGSFAKLCELRGDKSKAEEYRKIAKEFAERWVKEADDGDHFRLAFDRPNTWSQKYNLVWDKILGLNLFPAEVARKEMDYYKKIQGKYGLPLDNRRLYTKLDWITWTATLTQDRKDFEALIDPIYLFLNETPDRSPMTDWYFTDSAKKRGFTARPVVGGVFIQMLYDKNVWKKWAGRDKTKASNWAPMPPPPKITRVIAAADTEPASWRYTTSKPADGWTKSEFDDSGWQTGNSGFGMPNTPGAAVATRWNTPDIWLRRTIELDQRKLPNLNAWLHHDEDAEIYINGELALRARGYSTSYDAVPLNARGMSALKPGKNLIAIHCHQTAGGQYIDFGFVEVEVK